MLFIVFDSWGKAPSGVLYGNVYEFGNFDQCISHSQDTGLFGTIQGQHCTLMIPFDNYFIESHKDPKFMPPTRS